MTPTAVSEWFDPDGNIDQCGWCSALMAANKASLGAYPPPLAESKLIGEHGSTVEDNNAGLLSRYGWQGEIYRGPWAGFLAKLTPGTGAVVDGYYSALPVHFSRFDRPFAAKGIASYHAMYVERMADGMRIWLIDPLFHGEPGYKGEVIPLPALAGFATAFHGSVAALLVTEGDHVPGGDMLQISDPTPALVDLPKGAQLYDLAGKPLVVVTGAVTGQTSPYEVVLGAAHYRVARASPGGVSQVVLIHNPDANIRPVPPPVPDPVALANAKAAGREEQSVTDAAALAAARPK